MNLKNSLTEGPIIKNILIFAFPLFISSLIQQLYSTVDLIFAGKFLGTDASAAIGASGLLVTCLIGFFNGMAVGASVITAQHFGAKRYAKLKRLIQTVFIISTIGGTILIVFGILLTPLFLEWMGTPKEILELAIEYLRIYMLSTMSIITYNLCSGIVRAMGNSKVPMYFQFAGAVINTLANYFAVVILNLGVAGTAISTFVSQTFAAVCILIYLNKIKTSYSLDFKFNIFSMEEFKQILNIGIPSGIQSMIITLSNILIQAQINKLGISAIAAFTVYFRTELIVYLPILSLGQAVVAFVGQNYGACNYERLKKGNRFCIILGIIVTECISMMILFFAKIILSIFTNDPKVISITIQIMSVTFPLYFLYSVLECLSSNLRGYGKALKPMLITIISFCGFRILLLYIIMKYIQSVRGVAIVYPCSWLLSVILMGFYYIRYNKYNKKYF